MNNEKLLNTNLIISKASKFDYPSDIKYLNSIVVNNVSPRYKVLTYLGEGIHGSLYLVRDNNANVNDGVNEGSNMILKRIKLENDGIDVKKQINLELNILKYLSNNDTSRDYVNPCIDYKIVDKDIITLFPVFNGYSLNFFKKYLEKLTHPEYYKIVFHLIKTLLYKYFLKYV